MLYSSNLKEQAVKPSWKLIPSKETANGLGKREKANENYNREKYVCHGMWILIGGKFGIIFSSASVGDKAISKQKHVVQEVN